MQRVFLNSTLRRLPIAAASSTLRPLAVTARQSLPAGLSRVHVPVGPISLSRRWATSTTPNSTATDPAEADALSALEEGTRKLEEGDVDAAKALYKRSVEIKRTASALFNLGVTHYHSKDFSAAIDAWKESIEIQPSSPDAHTNLASAYIMSPISRPDLALEHLRAAASLAPEDPEISFNMAAVLEATGNLEEALKYYTQSRDNGVEKAAIHVRNVSAKILGKRAAEAAKGLEAEKDKAQ